ncbi:hypothetical protein Tco_1077589 [Tanacetum coccineum]
MSFPHKPSPKPSRVAKMPVRPIWRKKLNHCNSSNEVDVNLPTPMPKPQSPINEPTIHSNHVSLHSNVGQAPIPPQSINQSQTQTLFPHLLINPHVASVLHAQTPPSPQGDNHTQPPLPPSPSREMLMNDINQLQDLSNLLAMHLSQRNSSSSPYSPNIPHTINLDQVKQHVGYCPCCIFIQKQFLTLSEDINWIEFLLTQPQPPPQVHLTLSEDINWIEFLLTQPQPPPQVHLDYPQTTTSALNSLPTTN